MPKIQKKYHMKGLNIELTRRCNRVCAHCFHGSQQWLSISKEIINQMFEQLFSLETVAIVGGESFLELDLLEYLLEAIDNYHLKTKALGIFTNGSILDERVIKMFDDFVNKQENRVVLVDISADQFHDKTQAHKALDFYTQLNHNEKVIFRLAYENGANILQYSGYAKDYIDKKINSPEGLGDKIRAKISEASLRSHQINIKNGVSIECLLELLVNGNIIIETMTDYKSSDKLSIGNITKDSLQKILERHNDTCPYTCDETFNECWLRETRFLHDKMNFDNTKQHLINQIHLQRFEIAWMARSYVKRKFPSVPMQEIIHLIQPLTYNEIIDLCINAITHTTPLEVAQNKYFAEFQKAFPDEPKEKIKELSFLKYCDKLLCSMPFNEMMQYLKIGTIIERIAINLFCNSFSKGKFNPCEPTIDSKTSEIIKVFSV